MQFYKEFEKNISQKKIEKLKIKIAKKKQLKSIPKNIYLNLNGRKIRTKPVRTQSGVAPVAIMTKPRDCDHGSCTFCCGGVNSHFGDVPKSYTGNEPASMRAIRNKFDAYLQVFNRLEHYILLNQVPDKVELIIMGGTFLSYPEEYQENFVKDAFKAMNDFGELFFVDNVLDKNKFKEFFESDLDFRDKDRTAKIHKKLLSLKKSNKIDNNLEFEQLRNETGKIRCSVLVVETKPDWCFEQEINQVLKLGTTRVEIGIQTLNNQILKKTNRGHTLQDSIKCIQLLKDSFLKTTFHLMPGLPGSSKEEDINNFKELFSNQDFQPDGLKIYPCMVMPGTPLYRQYIKGSFKPIKTEEAAEIVIKGKKYIPRYARVYRILRDIPTKYTTDGVGITNFRQYLHQIMDDRNLKCQCIRCREPRNKEINRNHVKLKRIDYNASKGKEIFLSYDDTKNDILLGFLRLRIPYKPFRKEITKNSMGIREIHIYGNTTSLGKRGPIQHHGLGKRLVETSEKIANEEYDMKKILVTSGVGVRNYFYKLGYKRDGPYMAKKLN